MATTTQQATSTLNNNTAPATQAATTPTPLTTKNPIVNTNSSIQNYLGYESANSTQQLNALTQSSAAGYQNVGQQGQQQYAQGQANVNAAQSGQLTSTQQQQLNVTNAQISQAQAAQTANIQATFAANGITDPAAMTAALSISNASYQQQKTTAYTNILQQGQQLGLQQEQLGLSSEESSAQGFQGLGSLMENRYSTDANINQANQSSTANLIGGLLGSAASIGGALLS